MEIINHKFLFILIIQSIKYIYDKPFLNALYIIKSRASYCVQNEFFGKIAPNFNKSLVRFGEF